MRLAANSAMWRKRRNRSEIMAGSLEVETAAQQTAYPPPGRPPLRAAQRLDLDLQLDLGIEAHVEREIQPVVAAVERGGHVGAADFALLHRVVHALEVVDVQRERAGDAAQREFAHGLFGTVAVEFGEAPLEGGGGIARRVE